MTVVNLTALETALELVSPVARGEITATYWAGTRPFVNVAGAAVTFPAPIRVPITEGQAETTLDMIPTGDTSCVRWEIESFNGGAKVTRYTSIPDAGPVDFGNLPVVNPGTFEPEATQTVIEAITQIVYDLTYDRF